MVLYEHVATWPVAMQFGMENFLPTSGVIISLRSHCLLPRMNLEKVSFTFFQIGIYMDNQLHMFTLSDISHFKTDAIYCMLHCVTVLPGHHCLKKIYQFYVTLL